MPLKTASIEEPNLNLTPMIDIVFLLIIFFMVGTQFTEMERQYDIELPTVSDVQPLTTLPDPITVNVRRSGEIVVMGETRSPQELETQLQVAHENYADQGVLIRADGQGLYQHVMAVMEVCRKANIRNISLANRLQPEDAS